MKRTEEVYKPALLGKRLPILTLDNKWHKLFTQAESNACIDALAKELNELLMRQGKLNTETKEIKKLKTRLMDDIMKSTEGMEQELDKKTEKKLEESKRLIAECNEKLDAYAEELHFLPEEIDRVNRQLMLATMETCYDYLHENSEEIEAIDRWVREVRIELKKKLVRKQEKELNNHALYSYMHDIFGPDVIEIFDLKYNPEDKFPGKNKSSSKEKEGKSSKENAPK